MMGPRRLECRTLVTSPQLYILNNFQKCYKKTYTKIEDVSHAQNYSIQAVHAGLFIPKKKKKLSNIVRSNKLLENKSKENEITKTV